MEELIKIITDFLAWFDSTPLPKDTAETFSNLIKSACNLIIPLMDEYIEVFFE